MRLKKITFIPVLVAGCISIVSCQNTTTNSETMTTTIEKKEDLNTSADSHSFAKPNEAVATHLLLELDVNFDQKILTGIATYDINNKAKTNQIIFDTRDLTIDRV